MNQTKQTKQTTNQTKTQLTGKKKSKKAGKENIVIEESAEKCLLKICESRS